MKLLLLFYRNKIHINEIRKFNDYWFLSFYFSYKFDTVISVTFSHKVDTQSQNYVTLCLWILDKVNIGQTIFCKQLSLKCAEETVFPIEFLTNCQWTRSVLAPADVLLRSKLVANWHYQDLTCNK